MKEDFINFKRYAVYNNLHLIVYPTKEAAVKGRATAEEMYPDMDFTIASINIVLPPFPEL